MQKFKKVCEWIGNLKQIFCKLLYYKPFQLLSSYTWIFCTTFSHFKGIIVLHKGNIFLAFCPTTKTFLQSHGGLLFCQKKKPQDLFFPKQKTIKKSNIFCCVHHLSILLVPFPPSPFLRHCLYFGLETLDIRPLFVFLLPFPSQYVLFLYRIMKLLSLTLSLSLSLGGPFAFCDTDQSSSQKISFFCLGPTKSLFLRFRSSILGMNVRAGRPEKY